MNLRSCLTGILLVVLLAGAIFFIKRNRPAPMLPPKPVSGTPQLLKVHGPETAPVKMVEYSDFECPSCRVAQADIQRFFKDYPGKIQLTFKHFPLTSHRWSLYAHQAAECMNRQGKFWPYHDKIYEKQQEWAPSNVPPVEILARYVRELGGDVDQFGKCMADVAVTQGIYAEKTEGNTLQVNATPTLFLGGDRFVGPKEIQGRGENAIRKILGLPLKPLPEEKKEPPAPVFPAGIPKQKAT